MNLKNFNKNQHGYHLVNASPWPMISGFAALSLTFGSASYFHGYIGGEILAVLGLMQIAFMMYCWWGDIVREATFEGQHTVKVQQGLRWGVILFILSEVMFFFAFFWAFFHSSFNPSPAIGGVWPPAFIETINPWKVPLFNTMILLQSGAAVTWAHHEIVKGGSQNQAFEALSATVFLAVLFTYFQVLEYYAAPFTISDGIYGSTFYMATGFHGFHVIIGTIFLTVCLFRLILGHFTREHHFGFEAAAWYWHFVDVVWLFLFITIYWWGS